MIISNYHVRIEHLLATHLTNKDAVLAMPEDCNLLGCYTAGKPATWFILAKHAAVDMVRKWLLLARTECNDMANVHPFDQLVLWHCLMPQYPGSSLQLISPGTIPSISGVEEGAAAMGIGQYLLSHHRVNMQCLGGEAVINYKDGTSKTIPRVEFAVHCVDKVRQ